jgi:glutamyl-tRNA(Gln) amidotransferase subunit E
VIAALDHPPIMLHSESWPQDEAAGELLEELRSTLGCAAGDGLAIVWGAEEDTVTAAEEIRLRYADAIDGVPHETRQPFADGHTDFERILPGPDRMYPDTDSPPQAVTRARVERLAGELPESPWSREARYGDAGVPVHLAHYLIRRGGARLVDLVVDDCGADLRRACFFFGEKVKALRREGLPVDEITDRGWCELFTILTAQPETWHAWRDLLGWLVEHPEDDLPAAAATAGFGEPPEDWLSWLQSELADASPDHARDDEGRWRYLMGRAMDELRGRVPVEDLEAVVREAMTSRPIESPAS